MCVLWFKSTILCMTMAWVCLGSTSHCYIVDDAGGVLFIDHRGDRVLGCSMPNFPGPEFGIAPSNQQFAYSG